jgi:hypothetical protein
LRHVHGNGRRARRWRDRSHALQHQRVMAHRGDARVRVEQIAYGQRSPQNRSRRNSPLGWTRERRVVDANAIKEPERPCCWLDRLQDERLTLPSNGDGVSFQLKPFWQFYELAAVNPYYFSNFHRVLPSHTKSVPHDQSEQRLASFLKSVYEASRWMCIVHQEAGFEKHAPEAGPGLISPRTGPWWFLADAPETGRHLVSYRRLGISKWRSGDSAEKQRGSSIACRAQAELRQAEDVPTCHVPCRSSKSACAALPRPEWQGSHCEPVATARRCPGLILGRK